MPFWKCFYHLIWTTKNRAPVITKRIEEIIQKTIISRSVELKCPILAINNVSDHVHVATCIPPKIAIADWVRQIKGASAHEVNLLFPDLPDHFRWQESYGVLTFGARYVDFVVAYVEKQKEHHANNQLEAYLEQTEE
jgi:putative transposase